MEGDNKAFHLRRATVCDADAIGNAYSASFRLLTFLPILHTVAAGTTSARQIVKTDPHRQGNAPGDRFMVE